MKKYFYCLFFILIFDISYASIVEKHGYLKGFSGFNLATHGDTQIPSILSKPPLTSSPIYQNGYLAGLSLGCDFSNLFNIEGEYNYHQLPMLKIKDAIGEGTTTYLKHSFTRVSALFLNAKIHDFFNVSSRVAPYIGAGIGYLMVKNSIFPDPPIPVSDGVFFTKKEIQYNTWGYQGILGLSYRLTENFYFELDYRYLSTFSKKSRGQTNLGSDFYLTKQNITNHAVAMGLKWLLA